MRKLLSFTFLFVLITHWISAQDYNVVKPNYAVNDEFSVNTFSGNLFHKRQDIFIPGIGLDMDLGFFYNSADKDKNWGFGNGWGFNYNLFYEVEDDGSRGSFCKIITHSFYNIIVGFIQEDGSTQFSRLPRFLGSFNKLSSIGNGNFALQRKNGTLVYFENSEHKKVTRIVDLNGNTLTFHYADGRLIRITDTAGRNANFNYQNNLLTSIVTDTDPVRQVFFEYDEEGNMIKVTNAVDGEAHYLYNQSHQLTGFVDENSTPQSIAYKGDITRKVISCKGATNFFFNNANKLCTVIDDVNGEAQKTKYYYDDSDRVISIEGNCCGFNQQFEYDEENNISKRTDANGNDYQYSYDSNGNRTQEIDPYGDLSLYTYNYYSRITSFTDKMGYTRNLLYDFNSNLLSETLPENVTRVYTYYSNGLMRTFRDANQNEPYYFEYDQFGSRILLRDPIGGEQVMEYDEVGNRTKFIDKNSNETSFDYDAIDRLTGLQDHQDNETFFGYDNKWNVTSITNALGRKFRMGYDCFDNLIWERDTLGNVSQYEYDVKGNLLKYVNALGYIERYSYNKLNRLVSFENALSEISNFGYDPNGNLVFTSTPDGNAIQREYDKLNRLIAVSDQVGLLSEYDHDKNSNIISHSDGLGNTTTYGYDQLNRRVSETDPIGNTAYFELDPNGNTTFYTDRMGFESSFEFDALNRLILEVDEKQGEIEREYDPKGNLLKIIDQRDNPTEYEYNFRDQVTRILYPDLTETSYTHDALGNLESRTDNNGDISNYQYDLIDRHIRTDYTGSQDFEEFTYDGLNRVITATNQDVAVSLDFDPLGRLLYEMRDGQNAVSYEYSTSNRTRQIFYPSGRTILEQFDIRGRLTEIIDRTNELSEQIVTQSFDLANRLTNRIFNQSQNSSSWNYDANSRVIELTHSPNDFLNFAYDYDEEGNKLYEHKLHDEANSSVYQYDELHRLTNHQIGQLVGGAISSPVTAEIFEYDAVGNRTTYQNNDLVTSYQTNLLNQYTEISQEETNILAYDQNGNQTTGLEYDYSYDSKNRLKSVDQGSIAEYIYDALGRRIRKTTIEGTTNYIYDGINVIEEADSQNATLATYVYGQGMDDLIQLQKDGQNYFYFSNAISSISGITSSTGEAIETYSYLAFGTNKIRDGTGTEVSQSAIGNPYSFTSRRYDAETDQYHYRNRQFSSSLGRFSQRDPLHYSDGLGLYQYAYANPTGFTDPLGLCGSKPCAPSGFWDFFDITQIQDAVAMAYCNFYMGNYDEASDYFFGAAGRIAIALPGGVLRALSWLATRGVPQAVQFASSVPLLVNRGATYLAQSAKNGFNSLASSIGSAYNWAKGGLQGFGTAKGGAQGTNSVYRGLDAAGKVRYVGITNRVPAVRFSEHLGSGTNKALLRYRPVPGASNLSRTGARVWEQQLINQYGLGKNGGSLFNRINSISPSKWHLHGIR